MPFKMTELPGCAAGGARLVMVGLITSNVTVEGLDVEFTVTVTGPTPCVAVLGTRATICVLLQLVMEMATPPLMVIVLLPCEAPKLEPATVTDVPVGPRIGDTPVTNGVVPIVTETLSNVAVPSMVVDPLLTPIPMLAFVPIGTVWLPICVQFTPSGEVKVLKRLPLRTSLTQYGRVRLNVVADVAPPVLAR